MMTRCQYIPPSYVLAPSPRVSRVSVMSNSVTVSPICRMWGKVKMLPRSPACISVEPDGQNVEKKGGVEVVWALHLAPCFT